MIPSTDMLLETLGDVEVEVAARIGQARVTLAAAAVFAVGSIVPLECRTDAAVTLLVNGVAVVRGELVVMEDDGLAVEIADVAR